MMEVLEGREGGGTEREGGERERKEGGTKREREREREFYSTCY